ncbi:MAG: hypothetical protein H6716_29790 [Polyangiaceae bacterium]|jgi:hypothetical protein|nr:hypothetical protein [Planctomycetales bacterium]MCB9610814.1 hypothetical protein [Polyangiaceae bacterium]
MSPFLNWLGTAPQGAVAILTAMLAALVAVIVALLTQWILGRRARTDFLTRKLEELYLALNEVSAHNVKRAEEVLPYAATGMHHLQKPGGSSVERQALDLHKRIVMLVRLYFPKLSSTHQRVFRRNSRVHDLIHRIESGMPSSEEELVRLSGSYGEALAAMEQEIIANRLLLTKDGLFQRRYRSDA